ncbi:MAG: hypothetical protein U9R08_03760 [Nanoarchaeota archaeon]|nr:hypothetical protein [Nanoarchaeota archaeon]
MDFMHINEIVDSKRDELDPFMTRHNLSLQEMKLLARELTKTFLLMNEYRVSPRPTDFGLLSDHNFILPTDLPGYVKITKKGYNFYKVHFSSELKHYVN